MAYDDTQCPCGGRKLPETMLCALCVSQLAGRPEMRIMLDDSYSVNSRRTAAITLLLLARRRKHPRASLPA